MDDMSLRASICLLLAVLVVPVASTQGKESTESRRAVAEAGLRIRKETPHPWFDATYALCALHLEREVSVANRAVSEVARLWPVDAEAKGEPEAYRAFSALVRI